MIPIVIVNYNRVTTTKNLVEQLISLGYNDIHILDNSSTFGPLLDWYRMAERRGEITVHRLDRNYIQNAIYDCPARQNFLKYEWIAYTDSDLELNSKTPRGFVEHLIDIAKKYNVNKVGLALKIDDLPDTPYGIINREWEERFWLKPLGEDIYDAPIDSTFAVIKPPLAMQYEAIRVAGDYTCIHKPWYLDWSTLDEEELYYLDTAHVYSTAKRLYEKWKENKEYKLFG